MEYQPCATMRGYFVRQVFNPMHNNSAVSALDDVVAVPVFREVAFFVFHFDKF